MVVLIRFSHLNEELRKMPRPAIEHANTVKSLLQTSLDLVVSELLDATDEKNVLIESSLTDLGGEESETSWNDSDEDEGEEEILEASKDLNVEESETVSQFISNPFDNLTSTSLTQIIDTLRAKKECRMKIQKFSQLITPQTKVLDFSLAKIEDKNSVAYLLQLAANQSPQITGLLMGGVGNMCRLEYYYKFLPQFSHLQVLDVSCTPEKFNDSCMHIIGIYCRDLRELIIDECKHVTNDGINRFCGGANDLEMALRLEQSGQCKSLQKLSVVGTGITTKGVRIALQHFPHLKILEYPHLVEALAHIHRKDVPRPKYALTRLNLDINEDLPSYRPYKSGDLRIAASMCPFVTHLSIKEQSSMVYSNDLRGLTALERLRELKIANTQGYGQYPFDYYDLLPFLKAQGTSLTSLELEDLYHPFTFVCLGSIMEYCPNLKRLSLGCQYSLSGWFRENEQAGRPSKLAKTDFTLNHLEQLKVAYTFDDYGETPPLKELLLLSSPSLKELTFNCCDHVTDNVLLEVCQSRSFKSLEHLEFRYCNSVTKIGIDLFMNEENSLKRLAVSNCKLVSRKNIVDWGKKAKENNWELEIVYNGEVYLFPEDHEEEL